MVLNVIFFPFKCDFYGTKCKHFNMLKMIIIR